MCSRVVVSYSNTLLCIISYHAADVWLSLPTNYYATLIFVVVGPAKLLPTLYPPMLRGSAPSPPEPAPEARSGRERLGSALPKSLPDGSDFRERAPLKKFALLGLLGSDHSGAPEAIFSARERSGSDRSLIAPGH